MQTQTRNWVLARLQCRRCHASIDACVRVSREVPAPLRCAPGGGAIGGSSGCPHWASGPGDLQRAVEDELRKSGWGRHVRAGAVVLEF